MSSAVSEVLAWEALDSRGTPTVGCLVRLADGSEGQATVPSGASTGAHEAVELRDGGERYAGRGVKAALASVERELGPVIRGMDAGETAAIDTQLRAVDGTADLHRLGANAVLGVSIAAALAAAACRREPLYRFLLQGAQPLLPLPMVNILSGGVHAARAVDIQDFLIMPVGAATVGEAIEWASRVRRAAVEELDLRGHSTNLVADEGGLGPRLASNREALEVLAAAIERAGLVPGEEVAIAVDVAATQFTHGDGGYRLAAERRDLSAEELVDELAGWCAAFPIVSLEDPLAEDDWTGWAEVTRRLPEVQLLGDDLFVTQEQRLSWGIEDRIANAVLVKPNQVGTLSEAGAVVRQAQKAGYATVVSARSGDTEDDWLADVAIGWRAGQIKVGSTMRSERTAKWNRLLRLERELGADVPMASWPTLRPGQT